MAGISFPSPGISQSREPTNRFQGQAQKAKRMRTPKTFVGAIYMHFGYPFQVPESIRTIESSNNTVLPLPVGAKKVKVYHPKLGLSVVIRRTTYNLDETYDGDTSYVKVVHTILSSPCMTSSKHSD